jgi:hypothetical protein
MVLIILAKTVHLRAPTSILLVYVYDATSKKLRKASLDGKT